MNHIGTKKLETEHLILRRLELSDLEAFYNNWASDKKVTTFLTWPTYTNIDTAESYLKFLSKKYEDPDTYEWGIVLKEINEPIGSISAVHLDEKVNLAEIGYCLGSRWWHQGYTSEALKRVIRFFFEEVHVNKVEGKHDPRNIHSGQVMKDAGMKLEGTIRQSFHNNQGICDSVYYGILASEYFSPSAQ